MVSKMTNLPAFQFYPADWLNDIKLQACDMYAHGVLINMMCIMHQSDRYGYLQINGSRPDHKTVMKLLRVHPRTYHEALKQLIACGVLKEDENGIIYSPRMVKDQQLRETRREAGKKGGNPNLVKQKVKQKPTPSSSSSSSTSTSKKYIDHFEKFWKEYPRKIGKPKCKEWFKRKKPDSSLVDQMIKTVTLFRDSEQWQDSRYVPHPYTWLNRGGWEDEVPKKKKSIFD